MDGIPDRRPELSNRTAKKLLLPILWLCLVAWFFRSTFSRPNVPIDSTPPTLEEEDEEQNATTIAYSEATRINQPYGTLPNITYPHANITTSSKVAVIVETRGSGNIVPLVLHFSSVLGPSWPIVIYTSSENFGSFSTSAALHRYQIIGRVVVRSLAEGVWFPNWDSVSGFLTTSWLWEDLAPAEHVLLFQSDSVLCSAAVRSVEDFFEYDYIGAPIHPTWGAGFNGGLSLRRRSTILKVLTDWTYMPGQGPEDQWYYSR
ncbi:hypothetical protein D0Z07_1856 [Hyphodiscus hymeniophilus]|uniref:DUF5672 domain-containing protein n=1 Tax=Hyphodiscus hymeniophilus TaxID=353542 RepID=A0A9P6VQ19_9HELO|nr:hypothetical protein D0Z07_1856 [Hyphodiscus hymeniophilus]